MEHTEYIGLDGRVYVIWGDGHLHVWETVAGYRDDTCPPDEVIPPAYENYTGRALREWHALGERKLAAYNESR